MAVSDYCIGRDPANPGISIVYIYNIINES